MGFGSIFDSVRIYFSTSFQQTLLENSLALFKTYLNSDQNKVVRILVDSTFGQGHQSSSTNIVFQLSADDDNISNGFGYRGTIEIYYSNADPERILNILYGLLPTLHNEPEGKVNNATVKLIMDSGTPPLDQVNLGFTGGFDPPGSLSAKINSRFFLKLQPYKWSSAEEMEVSGEKDPIVLTDQRLLEKGAFKQRGYWLQVSKVPSWDDFSADYADQIAVLQSILSKIAQFDFGITYSIRKDSELASPPQERMFEVITGYMASQMEGSTARAAAKPIIVLSMDNFTDASGGAETKLNDLFLGNTTTQENKWITERDKEDTPEAKKNELIQQLKSSGYRKTYLNSPNVKAGTRIDYVWDATLANVTAKYEWLGEAKNNVLFIQMGRMPQEIFNYMVYRSTMPAIFEGQNTGNLAMQTGKPYFHVARPNKSVVQYPTTLLGYAEFYEEVEMEAPYSPGIQYVPGIVVNLQHIANQINFPLCDWPNTVASNPAEILGGFIRNYAQATGPDYEDYKAYYDAVTTYYQNPANDKFRAGVSFMGYVLQSKGEIALQNANTLQLTEGDDQPLNALLAKLYDKLHPNGDLDLFPGVYSAGQIFDFISGLLGAIVTLTSAVISPDKGTADPDKITVTGNCTALDDMPMAFEIVFTAPEGSVLSDWKMTYTGDWLTQELPWLKFNNPYVFFTVADTVIPAQGGVGGNLQGLDLNLSFRFPIDEGLWQLEGHFDKPQSIANFYQMAGGVNLAQSLPSPFNAFSALGVTDCQLAYDTAQKKIQYVSFVVSSEKNETVQLMQGLTMDSIVFNILITDPGSLTKRKTTWSINGKFGIGTTDPALIMTGMSYPGPLLSGQLVSGVIRVTDLFNLFLPGTVFSPQGYSPEISEFQSAFDGTTGDYSVTCLLNFDWTFQILPGTPAVTIKDVGVNVQSKKSELSGGISGGFTFGTGAQALSISVTANYDKAGGWVFAGQQAVDSTLSLSNLANQLLPSNWQIPAGYDYGLKNLNFSFAETTKYYEIGGETDGYWTIPFIDLNVRASLKFGYGEYGSSDAPETMFLVTKEHEYIAVTEDKKGYYCTLNADIDWIGIKMKVFYDYNPDVEKFGFTWGVLSGTVAKGADPAKPDNWIGTLKFTESVTLGYIVEEAISWLSGYKYGLASPWDLLNSLSLSALELIYDFTAKTVSFKLNIDEINLGFCKINAISVNYQSGGADTEKGVFITIDGSFFWLIGSDGADGNSDKQLNWDASKPEETPAPSGQGNKYLDLRMLALGQHVTIPGFANVSSVQEAIKAMSSLPETEPGQIPGIVFDANSSWLIGADFGLLRLSEDKSSGDAKLLLTSADDGEDADADYFINLQIVFNDPNLYALRIALNGEPARIFKGLDFQILYRKISDSVGVYQAQIALPDVMRKIQLGAVNITLPVFGIEIYTNGDFLIDLGFPYNADFSRSFTLQIIIYVPIPIPLMGSAGIYFGKKSSATSTEVPVIDNGTFNPVLVFGLGLQFGLGYDFNAGILAAGFSLTFVTIIEGVLAKFNPYQSQDISIGQQADIAPAYYYSIKGVVGIQGKLYGYVDFKIIKAEVNVFLSVLADITITAYQPILLGLTASVSVSVSIKINLGLFKIKISFSFDMTIRESYEIKVGGGSSPWHVAETASFKVRSLSFTPVLTDNFNAAPAWGNLNAPVTKAPLTAFIGCGLSIAGDLATSPGQQQAVYSAMLFIESVPSAGEESEKAALKAFGTEADTSFETLSKQVFRWLIAAFYNGSISAAELDNVAISEVRLQEIYDYLNNPDNSNPIPVTAINDFLTSQMTMTVSHPADNAGETDATYFPIAPQLSISLPAFDQQPELDYTFGTYNVLSDTYIHDLRVYFDDLAVQLQQNQEAGEQLRAIALQNDSESLGTFIFADYFLLIARQMLQNAQDALSAFNYQLVAGDTPGTIVNWTNTHGQFSGYSYTINDLFDNNKAHLLSSGKNLNVNEAVYSTVSGDTFSSISANAIYGNGFTADALALSNASSTIILQAGLVVNYPSKDGIVIQGGNSLDGLAKAFGVSNSDLLANATINNQSIADAGGLLLPSSKLTLPAFNTQTQDGDTMVSFSARYGISIDILAAQTENATVADLFDISDNDGKLTISDLPQFELGELIKEIQANNGLQQLSGMASRYYLSGLRLPTEGISPKFQGMWVNTDMTFKEDTAGLFALTGQQFVLPVLAKDTSYAISFAIPPELSWMVFDTGSTLNISIDQSSTAYQQIDVVRSFAQANYLDLDIEKLGLGDMFSGSYGNYSLNTVSIWQAGSQLLLPYSGTASQSLNIWTLPGDLLSLADPAGRSVRPRFQVQIGTVDPVTKAMKAVPVSNYGWGTQVSFTVKRVPLSADSAASASTYEISGADGNNALILEKMVTYLGNDDSLISQLAFGFVPNQSNGSNPGIQTDPAGSLTIGIAQANLSTFTRPDSMFEFFALEKQAEPESSNLLNDPTALITLLWQASITRDGGYYLYYYNSENGEGLPEHAFNDKGEALLTLVAIYSAPAASERQDLLQPYMNIFITGDPVNGNASSVFAQAAPLPYIATFESGDTLKDIAFQYFTNIGDVVAANPSALLSPNLTIDVPEGTYQVTNVQGEGLQVIADQFGTTVDAIKIANPVVTNWQDPLALYTGLRLPPLTVKAAATSQTKTLTGIAEVYKMDVTALANYNANLAGLFVDQTSLSMTGGPVTRVATVPAGVLSLEAVRTEPDAVPDNPAADGYAALFLKNDFSVLSFNLTSNCWFSKSNPSLPAGPTDNAQDPNNSYLKGSDMSGKWVFRQSVPYYKFANQKSLSLSELPDISTSPYKGIGYLVQADFQWLDIYGNTILTTLSQPPVAGSAVNQTPILTGYTDALIGVNQWPSVASAWQMANPGQQEIQILLSFDTSAYNGLLSATATTASSITLKFTEQLDSQSATALANYKLSPDLTVISAVVGAGNTTVILTVSAMAEDLTYTLAIGNIQNTAKTVSFNGQASFAYPDVADTSSSSIVQQATHDFQVYTQLWYQLTDPNGISITMQTSIFGDLFELPESDFDLLVNSWIAPIYLYLQDRSQAGITVAAPAAAYTLHFPIDPSKVVPEQIFEVTLSLSIERTGAAVMGEFETTGGIKRISTNLSPVTNSDSTVSRGLDEFADSFELVMSVEGQYYLKIATGADRNKLGQQATNGTIWAVRLGIEDTQSIAYEVVSPGAPQLFAPKPVSNKLESRSGVAIYTYSTGTGINFTTPDYQLDFTEIDLDQWVGTFFGAIDDLLTPEFTASIQLIDKKGTTSYLEEIQNNKEQLADIAKMLMVPVFTDETADPTPVREALKQALLAKLTNLYATNSGIQFGVNVKADKPIGTAPNLFGNFLQNTVFEGAVSKDGQLKEVTLYFSAPLDPELAKDLVNYTISNPPLTVISADLASDSKSVVLTVSADVMIGSTTVTINPDLLDANNRPLQGDLQDTIESAYVSYSKPDQITITAAKISLDESSEQHLAFLLTTPEIVRGEDGEVLSKIDLNLSYKATDIEHQIAAPVNGFTPSSWLSFVLPNVRVPLEDKLGAFPVPMFLRAFPQNPSLDNQAGLSLNIDDSDISKQLEWDYSVSYSQSFHYPQDILYFTVNFNVGTPLMLADAAIVDAFNQLAEFITVYPSVETDLKTLVTKIDAKVYYDSSPDAQKLFNDAGIAVRSFIQMIKYVVDAASAGNGLNMMSRSKQFMSMAAAEPYPFEIREGARNLNGKAVQVVSVYGKAPEGIGTPEVFIQPETYTMTPWLNDEDPCLAEICYYYINKSTGEPLLSEVAQSIQQREVKLPQLNILQRQDALTTVYLTRNEDLITEKTTNPDFVYTTGNLSFSNPYLPAMESMKEIEIANLPANHEPTTRSLFAQLQTLMSSLLAGNSQPSLSFQMVCSYDYELIPNLSPVNLPVMMQTMVSVELTTQLDPMLQSWTDNINSWITGNNPSQVNGVLKFDLVILSNLTQQPFPLVRFSNLELSLAYISK